MESPVAGLLEGVADGTGSPGAKSAIVRESIDAIAEQIDRYAADQADLVERARRGEMGKVESQRRQTELRDLVNKATAKIALLEGWLIKLESRI